MEIIDTQVHINQLGPGWQQADPATILHGALTAMDTLGVSAVIIDEFTTLDPRDRILPGYELPNGAWRSMHEFADVAAASYPDKFAFMARIDPQDPEMEELAAAAAASPAQVCLRVTPFEKCGDLARFAEGAYTDLFAAMDRYEIPVITWLPGRLHLLEPYLKRFSNLQFIIDHCGVEWPEPDAVGDARWARLDTPISFAKYDNLAMKWCHALRMSAERFPYRDLAPHLLDVLEAFGRERFMWGSDHTHAGNIWGESLYSVLAINELSEDDLEWIMGRTARTTFRWPASS